jgi:hypothetical protein
LYGLGRRTFTDWRLRDLLEDFGVRSDVARDTDAAIARLGETRYDAVISDEYRGGAPEGLALAQRMVRLAQRLDVDQGVDPILFEVPLIIYGTNSSRPPPPGVQLITNRPDEVLSKPDQQGRGDQTLTQRRLAKYWERLAATTETWIHLAMSRLMAKGLAKLSA